MESQPGTQKPVDDRYAVSQATVDAASAGSDFSRALTA
jgi:hypothetical protein